MHRLSEARERVSKDEFFNTIGRLNVHPHAEKEASYWETPNRELLGVSTPGYLGRGEEAYFITPAGRSALAQSEEKK